MAVRTHTWRVYEHGGPDTMRWESIQLRDPVPGQALIRHTAVGLNALDVEQRRGTRAFQLPNVLGVQATGIVESALGGQTRLHQGDRVAYAGDGVGAYAEAALVSVNRLVRVPDRIPESVAASLLDWLMVCFMLRCLVPIRKRDPVLVVDAASATGLVLCQWLRSLGAVVTCTVGNPDDAQTFVGQPGVSVVITGDDIGGAIAKLAELAAPRAVIDLAGTKHSCSAISRLAAPGARLSLVDCSIPIDEGADGTLMLSRGALIQEVTTPPKVQDLATEVFATAARMKSPDVQRYSLNKAKQAHFDRERQGFRGATVLLP
jgi:NADPH2:quinone reductase